MESLKSCDLILFGAMGDLARRKLVPSLYQLDKGVCLQRTVLDLSFSESFKSQRIPDAYERLLLEATQGNPALFIRRDEVEQAWTWIDSIQDAWQSLCEPPHPYPAGTWGPDAAVALLSRDNRQWAE